MKFDKFRLTEETGAGLILIFYAVGIAGHIIPDTLQLMVLLTPWVLLIFGLIVFSAVLRRSEGPILPWAVVTYLVTYLLEVLGVATGKVFGPYYYGPTLGFSLFEVPLVIGFNWMIIVLALSIAVFKAIRNPFIGALLVGAGATLFDWIMEPAAIAMDYWTWIGNGIPLQNYAAWFIIAFVFALSYRLVRIESRSRLGLYYVLIQVIFFIALRLGGVALG